MGFSEALTREVPRPDTTDQALLPRLNPRWEAEWNLPEQETE